MFEVEYRLIKTKQTLKFVISAEDIEIYKNIQMISLKIMKHRLQLSTQLGKHPK